jgi:hypothetical protein
MSHMSRPKPKPERSVGGAAYWAEFEPCHDRGDRLATHAHSGG